jgi:four helix bundle protein
MKQRELEERLLIFSTNIIQMTKGMAGAYASRHLAEQVTRSGTAPSLLYGEACGAESRKDFIHKMGIALKELRETKMNLRLIMLNQFAPKPVLDELLNENDQLIRIFAKSIDTAGRNQLK